jgi:hypothetical protein
MARWWNWTLLVGLLAGCGGEAPPAGTGAEGVVRDYCEALLQQDWPRAYGALHPESKAKVRPEEFARGMKQQRQRFGFEPEGVAVRSCEERGNEAIAHVIFRGRVGGKQRFYKDAFTLRRAGEAWTVVLSARFGQGG